MLLGWFDDTPKKPLAEKLAEAVARYAFKFDGAQPDCCLLSNEIENVPESEVGLRLWPVAYVRPNHYWVGKCGESVYR